MTIDWLTAWHVDPSLHDELLTRQLIGPEPRPPAA
jgi:hypothetical protein